MSYLLQSDFKSLIKKHRLADLLDDEVDTPEEVFSEAVEDTTGLVADHLDRYDIAAEFDKEGDERNKSCLYYCKSLCLYILYNRIPDDEVPERVIKNYNDAFDSLEKIAAGKKNITLPLKMDDSNGDGIETKKTKFRYGGSKPRKY